MLTTLNRCSEHFVFKPLVSEIDEDGISASPLVDVLTVNICRPDMTGFEDQRLDHLAHRVDLVTGLGESRVVPHRDDSCLVMIVEHLREEAFHHPVLREATETSNFTPRVIPAVAHVFQRELDDHITSRDFVHPSEHACTKGMELNAESPTFRRCRRVVLA